MTTSDVTERIINLVYAREPLESGDWKEKLRLFDMHAEELRGRKTDLNLDIYRKLEANGFLVFLTARDFDSGKLIGYSSHIWHHELHYSMPVAQDDAWFVLPQFRCLGIGQKLMEAAHTELARLGVKIVLTRVKVSAPHDAVLAQLGYRPYEVNWRKDL